MPEGDYIVRLTINLVRTFDEGTNRYPNVIEADSRAGSAEEGDNGRVVGAQFKRRVRGRIAVFAGPK